MKGIIINGEESGIRSDGLPKLADLIELIKNTIDPEHMITSIQLDGRDLTDDEWVGALNRFETCILEVETGSPREFVQDRFGSAASVVSNCFMSFREARKSFQQAGMQEGNAKLVSAVNTLHAFFEWYGTMLELLPPEERGGYDINDKVKVISDTCKKICQQQLYQSWWALGETLQRELEPQLDKLEDFCRQFAKAV